MNSNETTDIREPSAAGPGSRLPMRALRWVETQGLNADHAQWRKRYAGEDDAWWIEYRGEVEGPCSFRQVMGFLLEGMSPLQAIHASETENEGAEWRVLRYSPLWMRPWPARLWRVGFWVTLGVLGYCVVRGVSPHSWRWNVGPLYWLALAGYFAKGYLPKRRREATAETAAEELPGSWGTAGAVSRDGGRQATRSAGRSDPRTTNVAGA